MSQNPLVTAIITTYKREPDIVIRAGKSVSHITLFNGRLYAAKQSRSDL